MTLYPPEDPTETYLDEEASAGGAARAPARPGGSTGAALIGAALLGALAMGALAIGAVAIGSLIVGRMRVGRLEIGRLVIQNAERLRV